MNDEQKRIETLQAIADKLRDPKTVEILSPYVTPFNDNIKRVYKLLELYAALTVFTREILKDNNNQTFQPALDDLLRSSVVFIHTTLEEFLRMIAAKRLPEANQSVLDKIPLVGLNTLHSEKFSLGNLKQFKDKTINDVIAESVRVYLEHSSYNNVEDIASLIRSLGFDVSKVNRTFPKLAELMERRHLIVHRADRVESLGGSTQNVKKIDIDTITDWTIAVAEFAFDVLTELNSHSTV